MAAVACQRCGRVDQTLRLTVFPWVVSIVLMSFKRAAVGVYCANCRSSEKWKYLGISALFGWWGIPWGFFWTLEALGHTAGGGQQPAEQNAALLAALGQQLLQAGDEAGAREAWSASVTLKGDPVVERAILMLDVAGSASEPDSVSVRPGDVVRVLRTTGARSSPDASASVVASSTAGSAHVVLARRSGWTQVRLQAGVAGWLEDSEIVAQTSS
jgi:hypothetical protein